MYVGMTRGRHDNTALVVTDTVDFNDHRPPEPVDPVRLLATALQRPAGERAAIDEIRLALARSESLAVLKPRLANLDTWLKANTPVDHSIDLERARRRLADAERELRPGRVTRRGRNDRQDLDRLTQTIQRFAGHETAHVAWHDQHAETFAYRDQLARQINDRRIELGRQAVLDQPDHLTQMLGPYPARHPARDRWMSAAARIEAYREEWGVAPADLHQSPTDDIQHHEWQHVIDIPRRLEALTRPAPARTRDLRDHGVEQGFGIEL